VWNDGYTSEIDYTSNYYGELSPERMRLSLLAAGIEHSMAAAPDYLELGFGQGLSLVVNAATNPGRYWGNDFNPGQVANARELAAATGRQVTLLEDSFEELARRDDLPEFDVIALHGIWSWISDTSRAAIVEIARRRLKPGGIFYLTYNVMSGWAPMLPLRTLLAEYEKREASGQLLQRLTQSVDFAGKLREVNIGYFGQNTKVASLLDSFKERDERYLAHEYFNANWHPMSFTDVADTLADAKLAFATSATILETLPGISVPANADEVLKTINDPVLRELTKDAFMAQTFRRDIFVKGPRKLSPWQQAKAIANSKFIMIGEPDKRPKKIKTSFGEAELREDIYGPVVAALAQQPNATASVGQLLNVKELAGLPRDHVWQALLLLTGTGFLSPASTSTNPAADDVASKGLNKLLLERAEANAGVEQLAAPRLGAAIVVNRVEQMMMKALKGGEKDLAGYVYRMLSDAGQKIVVNGKEAQNEAEMREGIANIVDDFQNRRLVLLKRVGAY
jgi:SAM-dependent methyltransferase